MLSGKYIDFIYQVEGETIKHRPQTYFSDKGVYLIIDKTIKTIWIWAGTKSRLFHRYIASNWASKLKSRKNFYDYKYEVVKQGREPDDFTFIFNEIIEGRTDLNYPGESRTFLQKQQKIVSSKGGSGKKLTTSEKAKIKRILTEINEMQMHIKYSLEHIGKRTKEIEKILEK